MLNDNGAIIAKAEYDKKLYRQINKQVFFAGITCAVCGAILLILQIFSLEVMLLVCGIIILIGGIFFVLMYAIGGKGGFATAKSAEIELYRDYMLIKEFQADGTVSGIEKVYYNTLVKRRESKDYFLAYISRSAVYPIGKDGLSSAELNGVRLVLGIPQKKGEPPVSLPHAAIDKSEERQNKEGLEN